MEDTSAGTPEIYPRSMFDRFERLMLRAELPDVLAPAAAGHEDQSVPDHELHNTRSGGIT